MPKPGMPQPNAGNEQSNETLNAKQHKHAMRPAVKQPWRGNKKGDSAKTTTGPPNFETSSEHRSSETTAPMGMRLLGSDASGMLEMLENKLSTETQL